MKKIVLFITSVCICFALIGCINSPEAKAISMVVKYHPDFPSNQFYTITKKIPIGGSSGTTENVKFTTRVEKEVDSTYVVTLTKDWGICVNGEYAKSTWQYNVASNSITLLESNDNDNLILNIK